MTEKASFSLTLNLLFPQTVNIRRALQGDPGNPGQTFQGNNAPDLCRLRERNSVKTKQALILNLKSTDLILTVITPDLIIRCAAEGFLPPAKRAEVNRGAFSVCSRKHFCEENMFSTFF